MEQQPPKYRVLLDDLEAAVRVDPEAVSEQHEVTPPPELDDGSGHLPGNVRPFAV